MVTLFTCHPYGSNAQRILVHCDYDASAAAEADPDPVLGAVASFVPTSWSSESPLLNIENVLKLVGMLLVIVCAVLLVTRAVRQKRARRQQRGLSVSDETNTGGPRLVGVTFDREEGI